MATNKQKKTRRKKREIEGISAITVGGFKSIHTEQTIELGNLTVLAGANSTGKSSMVQPLLLLKQTLDEGYDPGPLLLSGPHVKFTSSDQILSRNKKSGCTNFFCVGITTSRGLYLKTFFEKQIDGKGFEIQKTEFGSKKKNFELNFDIDQDDILNLLPKDYRIYFEYALDKEKEKAEFQVIRNKCFLSVGIKSGKKIREPSYLFYPYINIPQNDIFEQHIRKIIHLPGLRGNPERTYEKTAVGPRFRGTFEKYVASIIADWQQEKDRNIIKLGNQLKQLGYTWKVSAEIIDAANVELLVGRLTKKLNENGGLVNIADAGFGVSQTLPVLVALLIAKPGQMVYIEQPEIHMHPKARFRLSKILVDAAKRGVLVIIETHSSLLLRGIQTLVAKGKISSDLVKLHWFKRHLKTGKTIIKSADMDEKGAFGDWPEDFDDVALMAESEYYKAVKEKEKV